MAGRLRDEGRSRRDFLSLAGMAFAGAAVFGLRAPPLWAQDAAYTEFLDWLQREEGEFSDFAGSGDAGHTEYRRRQQGDFQESVELYDREFEDYAASIAADWGENPILPGRRTWVDYIDSVRRVVDFEQGYAEVTVALESGIQSIADAIEGIAGEAKQRLRALFAEAVFSPLAPEAEAVDTARTERGDLPNGRRTLSVRVPIRNSTEAKAARFLPEIYKRAEQYGIPASVILSIIQVESAFNPLAVSRVPAYGLMQVVPATAGVDITKFLYGKKRLLTPRWLYDPANSILAGSTYLHILDTQYLRDVKDEVSRMCCVIAAYNTGPSNMAKAFSSRGLDSAVGRINRLSAKATYRQLLRRLPYQETRRYLPKVLQQMTRFSTWPTPPLQ